MPDDIRRKEEADAGFNPAEKKKGERMATDIMDDRDAGYNPAERRKKPAEWTQKMPAYNDGEMDEEKDE